MRLTPVTAALLVGLTGCSAIPADGGTLPPPPPPPPAISLALQPVVTGLSFPLYLTSPPGDPRLFVVEKGGRIRIIANGQVVVPPYLDVSAKVSAGSEQGLLGLAFHPRYATNGVFVINYTETGGDTRVATYRVTANPDVADPASEQIVLAIAQPFSNHNGGHVAFGPDGMLYVASGDGGSGGDPLGNGQDLGDLLGSLLRIDIRDDGTMRVPADNPFAGQAGARSELWDSGLRNPWRFAFDRANGDLYIGDVGQNEREEINVAQATAGSGRGANYGWAIYEGTRCFGAPAACTASALLSATVVMPVLEYNHTEGCSVTGGYVYRGAAISALRGTYFYSDFCSGWVRSFRLVGGQVREPREWTTLKPGGNVPSFGEDAAGELYILTSGGGVWRVVPGSP